MTSPISPSKEQVATAKIELAGVGAFNLNSPLGKTIKTILSALAIAEADTARLDWLHARGCMVMVPKYFEDGGAPHKDLRMHIDAASSQSPSPTTTDGEVTHG